MSDLLNLPLPGSRLFEELVLDFDVSQNDRRKFNFHMKCIPSSWLQDSNLRNADLFDTITIGLLNANKVPKFAYSFFNETSIPKKLEQNFGKNLMLKLLMMLKIPTGMRSISTILSARSILDCILFILKFFTKQLHLMISYLKLTVKIPQIVIFVISSQNLLFIFFFFFVNVTLLDPFGKSYLRSSKTSMMLILLLQILIRSLVFLGTTS